MRFKVLLVPVAACAVFSIADCLPAKNALETTPATSARPSVTPSGTARDSCLRGTWSADLLAAGKAAAAWHDPQDNMAGSGSGVLTVTFGSTMTVTYTDATVIYEQRFPEGISNHKYVLNGRAESTYETRNGTIVGKTDTSRVTRRVFLLGRDGEVELMGGEVRIEIDLSRQSLTYLCAGNQATLYYGFVTLELRKSST